MRGNTITEALLDGYEAYLLREEKSPATREKYIFDVRQFAAFLQGKEVNKERVVAYKGELETRYAVRSANSKIASLNSFFRFRERRDLCVRQFRLQKPVCCAPEKELMKEEYYCLLRTAKDRGDMRLSLLMETICATGIRISELPSVTAETLGTGEVTVRCKGKTRPVFLVKALRKKLTRYASENGIRSGPLFITRSGKPLDRSNIWRMMKALCAKAGIPKGKVFPHNLRHLFARTFYKEEPDLAKLADVLGHTNINTTRIYIITTFREYQNRLERLRLTS